MSLAKTFDPAAFETELYQAWEENGTFTPQTDEEGLAPYVLMMPPPNVTGTLHMGHALTYTLPDILLRYHRMQGREVFWQPGMDHAGIATQLVVEKQLTAQGLDRRAMGREAFLEKVWAWKEESGGIIVNQQRRLGISPHWEKERFTLDEGLNEAVRHAFVTLYEQRLLYRDKRLVNWDPVLLTAVSDLEVQNIEAQGHYWHIRYLVEGTKDEYIVVATSRPETLLGDQAVAVHPDDERYQHLIGKHVLIPLVGRRIPIIADTYCDPEKGTGAVKITPAHDFNDFEVGKRHDLTPLNILDIHARLNENAPGAYQGLDRFVARKQIIADLDAQGDLVKIDTVTLMVPKCERTGEIVEPFLTDQWFVDAATLAKPALAAVKSGEVAVVPEQWKATYYHWMENIQPWCVSRQLWWGHRIPAWYGPDGHPFVAKTEEDAQAKARAHYGADVTLTQDTDVLDTWFSSALWPFSTLGWPENTPELAHYYPTSVLVTGVDILFFWVARMMMMGYHFMKAPPFKTIYLHALVRDEKGQKMSKSKGNIVNPLDIIDNVGADALRFTLASLSTPGRNINFSKNVVEGYRNFATKLWNAARFCEHYECVYDHAFDPKSATSSLNRWLLSGLHTLQKDLEDALSRYRFDEGASLLYQFIWGQYCDWYVEFAKPILMSEDADLKIETKKTAVWVLGRLCHLLHPYMPFVTEKLWMHLTGASSPSLITSPWPKARDLEAIEAVPFFDWLIDLITAVRSTRTEVGVPAGATIQVGFSELAPSLHQELFRQEDLFKRLVRADGVSYDAAKNSTFTNGAVSGVVKDATFLIPVGDLIDAPSEKARLEKALVSLEKEIKPLQDKLDREDFVSKAPEEIVEKIKERLQEAQNTLEKTKGALVRITALIKK
jgi:valyl-tRNA synthetase